MGVIIPQVVTSDRATGAQVIDGSLTFQRAHENYLTRAVSSEGDRQKWTFSCWIKRDDLPAASRQIWGQVATNHSSDPANGRWQLYYDANENLNTHTYNQSELITSAKFRDTGWYHVVQALDTTLGSSEASSRVRLYINGVEQTGTRTNPTENARLAGNSVGNIVIGTADNAKSVYWIDAKMAQIYFIDGQQLGPEYFGFTDPLTGIWKPKKYVNTTASHGDAAGVVGFGTNGFYLPLDGSAPAGQDQSGQGNDFSLNGFSGSVALDNPNVSGARPILNTTQGGTQAGVGVFGSKQNVGYAVTVYDDGGGNKYYIDGVKQATLTGLIRGATYTFDTSDSTVSSHPFRFSESDGGSEYTNGVVAITGAATTITIPYNSSNELYYYCTSHSGMGSSITGITTNEKLADQYASNCVLALPLVGVNNDVSASIACTARNKTATNSSVTAATTQSNFYSGSHYWSANSDTLQYAEQGDELVFGTSDFTIECWVYDDNGHNGGGSGRCYIFDNRIGGSVTGDPPTMTGWVDSHNEFTFYDGDSEITHTVGTTVGKWWHYAVTREGTTTRMFIDGILRGSSTSSTNFTNNGIGVGRATDGGYGWSGYIQDFRVYKGIAKYTSDFVVPSTSPDILPDTPSGVVGGSKLTKITDGAVSFDGNGDYLEAQSTTDFAFGTGDFTLEAYIYATSLPNTNNRIFCSGAGGAGDRTNFQLMVGSAGYLEFAHTTNYQTANGLIGTNKWYHVAATREGTSLRMFIDGVLHHTGTSSVNVTENGGVTIGREFGYTSYFNGYISNARILKGTALYTSNFTPPTAPLTNVTNTKLLCCQSVAEQQNNFIRMFLSDTLYTTKADILANATEVDDGESGISNKYWYIVPTGTEPIGSDVFTNDGSVTTPHASNHFALLWRNGSSWTKTIGTYGPSEYSDFDYKSDDDTSTYSVYPARDFYVFGVDDGSPAPELISGTLPTRAKYYKFDGAVKPGAITANGDAAATNFNPFNTDINTVRGQETGYCTANPLDKGALDLSNGNLRVERTSDTTDWDTGRCTIKIPDTGRWYWEMTLSAGSNDGIYTGVGLQSAVLTQEITGFWGYNSAGYAIYNTSYASSRPSMSVGDTACVSFDRDNNKMWVLINGATTVYEGNPYSGTDPNSNWRSIPSDVYPVVGARSTGVGDYNFGQKPFKFPPPDGFQPLNAANTRPETVITRPDQYVGIITYVGAGATKTFTGLNFGDVPDLVWMKNRDRTSYGDGTSAHHFLYDTVRGTGTGKMLTSSTDEAEGSKSTEADLDGFVRDGFRLDAASGTDCINNSGDDFVAWCWKAGGNKNTFNVDGVGYASAAAAGLSGQSSNITINGCSIGTKQGFSIVKVTPSDNSEFVVPHGLSQQPDFLIIKNLGATQNWDLYFRGVTGSNQVMEINTTNALTTTGVTVWNSVDSTKVSARGASFATSTNSRVVYFWHSVPGFSKFGTYEGTGVAGNYVHLGFRPALIWIKNVDDTTIKNWGIIDSTRSYANVGNHTLATNLASAESAFGGGESVFGASNKIDLLSDGFTLRETSGFGNTSGITFLYCAWAEAPSVDLYGGGANAR